MGHVRGVWCTACMARKSYPRRPIPPDRNEYASDVYMPLPTTRYGRKVAAGGSLSQKIMPRDLEDMLDSLDRLGGLRYREYLHGSHWIGVCAQYLTANGGKCKVCGFGVQTFHHRSYKHLGMGRELLDVVGLCKACHHAAHELILLREPGVTLWNAHTKLKLTTKEAA